jgi:pimeloyl-ACP methyl ester carboxylesterase
MSCTGVTPTQSQATSPARDPGRVNVANSDGVDSGALPMPAASTTPPSAGVQHDVDASAPRLDASTATTASQHTGDAALASALPTDPQCQANGCLRSIQSFGDYSREALQPYLDPGVTIDNGYSVLTIEYVTNKTTSFATVTIPYPRDPASVFPVVANAHGTVGLDDPCQLSGTTYGTGLAGLFGARAAIGVTSDYPGLGTSGLLPYLVSEVEGTAVLDSLRAVQQLTAALGIAAPQRFAVVGLSEGGHAVLAAAALHASYAPELDIRAFAAAAPATVRFEDWQAGVQVDGAHIPIHAMLIYAWASYYHYTGPSLWTPAVAPRIDAIMMGDCGFDFGGTRSTFESELGDAADAIFDSEFLRDYRAGQLPASAHVLSNAFEVNRAGPYQQTAPLAIWQGDADQTVLPADTAQFVSALQNGGDEVEYHVVPGGDHLTTAFGYVSQNQLATEDSIAWVQARLQQ